MQINIPDPTVSQLQAMLARQGEAPDVEAYVQRTLAKRLLFETVNEVRDGTSDVSPEEITATVEEAISETRKARTS